MAVCITVKQIKMDEKTRNFVKNILFIKNILKSADFNSIYINSYIKILEIVIFCFMSGF